MRLTLHFGVPFRDDAEALRARVESLESELAEAKETIARMKGGDALADLNKLDALPRRPFGWKRRVRRFRGALSEDDYERLAHIVATLTQLTMTSARAGRVFTMSSPVERIVVMAGEDDEVVLVFDEYDLRLRQVVTPVALAILPMAAMNTRRDPYEYWPIMVGIGVLVGLAMYALFVRHEKKRFAEGDKLFEAVGAHIERSLACAPAAAEPDQEEIEVEQTSKLKTNEA